jgi:hypothetical protein
VPRALWSGAQGIANADKRRLASFTGTAWQLSGKSEEAWTHALAADHLWPLGTDTDFKLVDLNE